MTSGTSRHRSTPSWLRLGVQLVRRLPLGRYRAAHWLSQMRTAPFVAPIGVTGNRAGFVCDLRETIGREVCFMGYYEPQETAIVSSILQPGMTFVDVGANWGYFTLLAADLVGPEGTVLALEPHPLLFELLKENILFNRFDQAIAYPIAAAERSATMMLASYDDATDNRGVSRLTDNAGSGAPAHAVQTETLDVLLSRAGIGDVDLLKIDIEGAERQVLPTLAGDLARGRFHRILLELHPAALSEHGVSADELVDWICGFGYRASQVDHRPASFRRAAYSLPSSAAEVLVTPDADPSTWVWPHFLFLAPGIDHPR